MSLISIVPFAAAISSFALGVAGLSARTRAPAAWAFFAGTVLLGLDSLFAGFGLHARTPEQTVYWLTLAVITKSFVPAAWLWFSVTYARGDYRESAARRAVPLGVVAALPIALSLGFREELLQAVAVGVSSQVHQVPSGIVAWLLNVVLVVAVIVILMNLEQTFRSAVGTTRWRIKFVVLGLAVIFGARLYVRSQAILFSAYDTAWTGVEASALLIGCVLIAVGYLRTGLGDIALFPSRAVLRSSLTVLIAGGYLFIVGVGAKLARRFDGAESIEVEAFVVLLGMAGLAVLLLSDRLRQRLHNFISRHFRRAQYDSVRVWTDFSRAMTDVRDQARLCAVSARLVSKTFDVLAVTVWVYDEQKEQFVVAASTASQPGKDHGGALTGAMSAAVAEGLRLRSSPFDLEAVNESWAGQLRHHNPSSFPNGGNRWCVPLMAGERSLGAFVLADRVNGAGYTGEELELLRCIADQVTSMLLNLRLANEVARTRELEAFRTMSAFFVHDLKNAAMSLNLVLENFAAHVDDPAFRTDAATAVGNTARRIEEMIARLSALRQKPELRPVQADLNQLVAEALDKLNGLPNVELTRDFEKLPDTLADREQIESVVTNLVLNARDALQPGGHIRVRTEQLGNSVVLSVSDDGCGMTPAFVKESLFRPFQSTKKKGLGIGMFQSRMIVEAHGGSIRVESEAGKGTTFRVSLPVRTTYDESQVARRR